MEEEKVVVAESLKVQQIEVEEFWLKWNCFVLLNLALSFVLMF